MYLESKSKKKEKKKKKRTRLIKSSGRPVINTTASYKYIQRGSEKLKHLLSTKSFSSCWPVLTSCCVTHKWWVDKCILLHNPSSICLYQLILVQITCTQTQLNLQYGVDLLPFFITMVNPHWFSFSDFFPSLLSRSRSNLPSFIIIINGEQLV